MTNIETRSLTTQFIQHLLQSGTIIEIEPWNEGKDGSDLYLIKNMIIPVNGNAKTDGLQTRSDLYFDPGTSSNNKQKETKAWSILSFFVKECEDLPEKLWSKQNFESNVIGEGKSKLIAEKKGGFVDSFIIYKVVCFRKSDIEDYCKSVINYSERKKDEPVELPNKVTEDRLAMNFQLGEILFDNCTKLFLDDINHCHVWEYDGREGEVPRSLGFIVQLNDELLSKNMKKKMEQWDMIIQELIEITNLQIAVASKEYTPEIFKLK